MKYFYLEEPVAPWGDYGDILLNGMAGEEDNGDICLQRVGPYIPPISFPSGNIIVTDNLKDRILSRSFSGFTFREVIKTHIVDLDLLSWDMKSDGPEYYPESGEPEDFILEEPHSPEISRAMGLLWAIVVPRTAEVIRKAEIVESKDELALVGSSTEGHDLVASEDVGYVFISGNLMEFLNAEVSGHFSVTEANLC